MLENLVQAMKSDIRYAENTVNYENDKLRLIGWSGRKTPTPTTAPGKSVRSFSAAAASSPTR